MKYISSRGNWITNSSWTTFLSTLTLIPTTVVTAVPLHPGSLSAVSLWLVLPQKSAKLHFSCTDVASKVEAHWLARVITAGLDLQGRPPCEAPPTQTGCSTTRTHRQVYGPDFDQSSSDSGPSSTTTLSNPRRLSISSQGRERPSWRD